MKVWLAQKNIRFGVDNLDGHCIQIIVAYLIQSRRIGQQTAVLGAFQTVLSFLADTKFDSTELNFVGENNISKGDSTWPATLNHPVGKDINDVSFNSLWRVSSSAIQDLKNESKIALRMLQLEIDTSFYRIFLEEKQYLSRYDLIFHVPLKTTEQSESFKQQNSSSNKTEGLEDTVCKDMTIPQYVSSRVLSVVSRALSNRVKLISSTVRNSSNVGKLEKSSNHGDSAACWDSQSKPIDQLDSSVVTIGVILDNDHAHRRVDKGDDVNDDKSSEINDQSIEKESFRSFWGQKSELRRFKDGSIVDAVVWAEQDVQVKGIKNILYFFTHAYLRLALHILRRVFLTPFL
jgi:U3 small nucleolar RNA-associated protein 22